MFTDLNSIRKDYTILDSLSYGRPLVYLDNAATTQVPDRVLDRVVDYYRTSCANVHRGAHRLSEEATSLLENARNKTASFIGSEASSVIFTSGATASINMAANMICESLLREGKNIVITALEHHSDLVPWQQACNRKGAELRVAPLLNNGDPDIRAFKELVDENTVLAAVCAVSNVLGTVVPIEEIISVAHEKGALVLIDAAQAMRLRKFNVNDLDCDFFCFSAHKMMGPTGVGVLYIRPELADSFLPVSFGGGMIDRVSAFDSSFASSPAKFEAGTPNIAGIIGLGAAVEYLDAIGIDAISGYEDQLLMAAEDQLRNIKEVRIFGEPSKRHGCLSFEIKGLHPYDTAALLDRLGICVRAGHHCAQPLMDVLGVSGTVRLSPAFYNTIDEIDYFCDSVRKIIRTCM